MNLVQENRAMCLRTLAFAALSLALWLAAPVPFAGAAATYFVATNGDDSNPGTEVKPWKTLSKSSACANPGDTVRIKAGEYYVGSQWSVTKSGTAEKPITYQGYGGEVRITNSTIIPPTSWKHVKDAIYSTTEAKGGTIFRGDLPVHGPDRLKPTIRSVDQMIPNSQFTSDNALYVWLADGSHPRDSVMRASPGSVVVPKRCQHIVFDGLTVEYGHRGISVDYSDHIMVRNCTIRSISFTGVGAAAVIERCLFQKIGSNRWEHAIYTGVAGTVIRNCVFEEISGAGIHLYTGEDKKGGNCEFSGNVFRKPRKLTSRDPSKPYYEDIIAWGAGGHKIYNNVFYGEGKRGGISLNSNNNQVFNNTFVGSTYAVGFGEGKTGNRVFNNIVQDAARPFVIWPAKATPQTLDYNIYFNASASPKWEGDGKSFSTFEQYQKAAGEVHSKYVDPGLAGPADARLKAGSPAIDAGVALKEVVADKDGVARPQGKAYDVGAYEFKAAK